jgi:hypothetical protein
MAAFPLRAALCERPSMRYCRTGLALRFLHERRQLGIEAGRILPERGVSSPTALKKKRGRSR